jgi:hypothetical protein
MFTARGAMRDRRFLTNARAGQRGCSSFIRDCLDDGLPTVPADMSNDSDQASPRLSHVVFFWHIS